MEPASTVDFLRNGLRSTPFGSLILVVCHEASPRDTLLAEMSFAATSNAGVSARWISLSEKASTAEERLQHVRDSQLEMQSDRQAEDEVPSHDLYPAGAPVFGEARTPEQIAANDETNRRYHAAEKDRERRVLAAKQRIRQKLMKASAAPTIASLSRNRVEEAESFVTRWSLDPARPCVFFLDDLLAVQVDGKRGSAKTIGAVARCLKDIAVSRNVIIVAGAPAPMLTAKDRHSLKEFVVAPTPQSLASYGSPHESADVVVGFKETMNGALSPVFISNRYATAPFA